MSRHFNNTTDMIEQLIAPITGYPCSFSCWFNRDALTTSHTVIHIGQTPPLNARILNYMSTSGETIILCTTTGNTNAQAVKGTYTAGSWFNSIVVCDNTSSRIAYLNGVAGSVDTANIPVSGFDIFRIGDNIVGDGVAFGGSVAEVGIWNITLLQPDIDILQKFSPRHVRIANLKAYVPLIREIQNYNSGIMTASGTTVVDHPRIFY